MILGRCDGILRYKLIMSLRPDMVVKTKNECKIIDFACHAPLDSRIEEREKDKMQDYSDLKREVNKIWDMPVKVIPVVVGALGTTPKKLKQWLSDILYSARILRNVHEV